MCTREERVWEAEGEQDRGESSPAGHSPLAQKTPTRLESEKGTLRTSLWLSKRLSGPSQLSTMGDMSCRSGENGALETTLPAPHRQATPPSSPASTAPRHSGRPHTPLCHTPSNDASWLLVRSGPRDVTLSRSQFTSRTAP